MVSVNSTNKFIVRWNSTLRPGSAPYCLGSRRWSVAVFPFSANGLSVFADNHEDLPIPNYPQLFTPTIVFRDTFFEIDALNTDEYYIFVIQNMYEKTKVNTVYQRFASPIYYFGEQSKSVNLAQYC